MCLLFLFMVFNIHICVAMNGPTIDTPAVLIKKLFEEIKNNKLLVIENMIKERPQLVKSYSQEDLFFSDQVCPLHVAVARGNDDCVNMLLAYKANPNDVTKYKLNTPLHYVQTVQSAQLLVHAGAKVDQENAEGRTALWSVFMIENRLYQNVIKPVDMINVAQFLFSEGADINKKDKQFDTLLHYVMRHKCVHGINFLLHNYADQDQGDGFGVTPLDIFIKDQQSNSIIQAFARQGTFFFPKMSPVQLFTANHESLNSWASVFFYINKKKDTQNFGSSILPTRGGIMCNQYGCLARNVSYKDLEQFFGQATIETIKSNLDEQCKEVISLVRNGDYAGLKEKIEKFPFVIWYRDIFTQLMVKEAVEINDGARSLGILLDTRFAPKIINMQILNWGPKLYTQQGTFLHLAVFCNNVPAIKVLMNYKADCLMVDRQKRTPMIYAQTMNRQDCIKELNGSITELFLMAFNEGDFIKIDQLLEQIADCNSMMSGGNLLLHNILHCLNPKTKRYINALVDRGANPEGLNEDGESPLWHLMRYNKNAIDIFEQLLSVGARVNRPLSKAHYSLLALAVRFKKNELVKLFLQYGALINKKIIEDATGDMQSLLLQVFSQQKCCMCNEHKDNLNDLLCKNRHVNKFICIACHNRTHLDNNACPFCSERLN